MSSTAWAAWMGAIVAGLNTVAIVVLERRRDRPTIAIKASYVPGVEDDDRYGDFHPSRVRIVLTIPNPTVIRAAGLARTGWLWRLRRIELDDASIDINRSWASVPYAATQGWVSVVLDRSAAIDAGVDPDQNQTAWVELGSGHRLKADVGALQPSRAPE